MTVNPPESEEQQAQIDEARDDLIANQPDTPLSPDAPSPQPQEG